MGEPQLYVKNLLPSSSPPLSRTNHFFLHAKQNQRVQNNKHNGMPCREVSPSFCFPYLFCAKVSHGHGGIEGDHLVLFLHREGPHDLLHTLQFAAARLS
jgi:hypothetical protein